jgi:hypothetical protein
LTNAALKELAQCRQLDYLGLEDTKINDAGIKDLRPFTRLTDVRLYDTAVTDAGLKDLAALKQLRFVTLGNRRSVKSGITEEGVERLQNAQPNLYVSYFDHRQWW